MKQAEKRPASTVLPGARGSESATALSACENSGMDRKRGAPALMVVVTGAPGAGKTSLARPLAEHLALPLITKDDLKEILFETLGWGDRARSRALSDAAYEVMFHIVGALAAAGNSLVLEANFRPAAAERMTEMGRIHGLSFVQIRCFAEPSVMVERLVRRAEGGLRHPGHLDNQTLPEMLELATDGAALELGCPVIDVDTSEPQGFDVELISRQIASLVVDHEE